MLAATWHDVVPRGLTLFVGTNSGWVVDRRRPACGHRDIGLVIDLDIGMRRHTDDPV
jgi:hypothetical protein